MNQTVLVTGASSGMGKATAQLLAQNGYTVYASARRLERMEDLSLLGIRTLYMDLADEASLQKGVQQIMDESGSIDILVNNAGFGAFGAVEDMSLKDAKYQFEVNLFGAARLIQLVLPAMRKNRFGQIVNISSVGGKFATPYGGWYHASKFALEGLSDALRNEVKQFGIDVIIIEPGGIQSEWGDIAMDTLAKSSINSVYKTSIDSLIKIMKDPRITSRNVPPSVIAKLILKAIKSKNPKARYVDGFMASPIVWGKKLLPDNIFDSIIMSQLKKAE
ncbi:MAG: SDR family NAD(P)-dependent oxidoreductase [Chitinophagales bacterium]|nr:SDR family NAD(P)-dependent oxidoreductase [Chitinophagales bacterium]